MRAGAECTLCCCWLKRPIDDNYVQLTDGSVKLNGILTGFLSAAEAHF